MSNICKTVTLRTRKSKAENSCPSIWTTTQAIVTNRP